MRSTNTLRDRCVSLSLFLQASDQFEWNEAKWKIKRKKCYTHNYDVSGKGNRFTWLYFYEPLLHLPFLHMCVSFTVAHSLFFLECFFSLSRTHSGRFNGMINKNRKKKRNVNDKIIVTMNHKYIFACAQYINDDNAMEFRRSGDHRVHVYSFSMRIKCHAHMENYETVTHITLFMFLFSFCILCAFFGFTGTVTFCLVSSFFCSFSIRMV